MMKKMSTKKLLYSLIAIIVGAVLLYLLDKGYIGDAYIRRILNLGAIYCIVSVSMNLVNGFTGLFSLGQAGFMAIGAYSVAIFTVPVELREAIFYIEPMAPWLANVQLPFFVALILGGLFAALAAVIIGAPVLRLKSDYLAIATLGFSEIIRIIFNNIQSVTNGALGINRIPTISTMWLPFGIAAIVIVFILLLINSSYGRALKAIRDDDIAAESMGVNLFKHKVLSFALGAFFTGIGGGLLASLLGATDPKQFYFTFTYNFLLIIVLGGMGSISGSIISSFIVVGGLEWLRFLDAPIGIPMLDVVFRPGLRMVVFSLLLVVIVLFYSKGIMGTNELTWDFILDKVKKITRLFKKTPASQGGDSK